MPPRYPNLKKFPLPGGENITSRMVRDNYKRHMFAEEEKHRVALRYISQNTTLPMRVRIEAQLQLQAMPNYTRYTQVRNRCVESGYARSVLHDFRLCRMKFRDFALQGRLPGVKKASW
ncbi:small ribosomal subunit protein uS14m [Trichomonascus vanleenenianus]|uniref:mitochondrial 37S ribosomal protein uS14m MRP2 n=1 Tax=Trichomonascus vanleenenianus TaxID=2268995 RepID=UPI003ECA291F